MASGFQVYERPGVPLPLWERSEVRGITLIPAFSGAHLLQLPAHAGRVDLAALIRELAARQCNDILVECGARLAGSLLQRDLVDEIVLYLAPALLGSNARPLFDLPIDDMEAKLNLQLTDLRQIGNDLRLILSPKP